LLKVAQAKSELNLFIILAVVTGGRTGAIMELKWEQIDLDRGLVDLRYYGPYDARRKGRAVVPIAETAIQLLMPFRPPSGGRVFTIGARRIRYLFRAACRQVGIGDEIVPTVLRHTVATEMILEMPMIYASRMLGHKTTKNTERVYAHVVAEKLRPAANVVSRLLSPRKD
jgi:integrase